MSPSAATLLDNNRLGAPNCTGFTNTTACMGYNANTQTLTNSMIYRQLAVAAPARAINCRQPMQR
jgi:hypothetical protein